MTRFTSKTINERLTDVRNGLRAGTVKVLNGNLRPLFVMAFGVTSAADLANTAFFNPQTINRFQRLFDDMPMKPRTGITQMIAQGYPSQDDFAWAIQNFMNRRADPWAFRREPKPVEASAPASV